MGPLNPLISASSTLTFAMVAVCLLMAGYVAYELWGPRK